MGEVRILTPKFGSVEGISDHVAALVSQVTESGLETLTVRAHSLSPTRPTDLVLLPTPYLEFYPRRIRSLVRRRQTVYFGYGLPGICDWPEGEVELPVFRKVTYLCASSPSEAAAFKQAGVEHQRVRWTGDPLLFEILGLLPPSVSEIPRLLWAPHWTRYWFDNPGFSNWSRTVLDLERILRTNPELQVCIRPHPFLPIKGNSPPRYAREQWQSDHLQEAHAALESILKYPWVFLSKRTMPEDLAWSTHVLTDGISMIGYGFASGRPTRIVRRDDSPLLGEQGQSLVRPEWCVSPGEETWNCIEGLIQEHGDSKDALDGYQEQRALIAALYPVHDKSPGELLSQWILGEMS